MKEYEIEEKLIQHKKTYLTKEVYKILWREKLRLKKEGVKISIQKLVNNAIIKRYTKAEYEIKNKKHL